MRDFYLDREIEAHSKDDPKIIKDCYWCEEETEAAGLVIPGEDNTICDDCRYPHTADPRIIIEFLESKVCYLENYQIGPRRKLEKSQWEKLFGRVFDWEQTSCERDFNGPGLLPCELTRAAILNRLIEVVDLLELEQAKNNKSCLTL